MFGVFFWIKIICWGSLWILRELFCRCWFGGWVGYKFYMFYDNSVGFRFIMVIVVKKLVCVVW